MTLTSCPATTAVDITPRTYWWGLWLVLLLFFCVRLPLMYRLGGQTDEDAYAVPGLTILKTGLPQIPYTPSRLPQSVFYNADQVMYCMPPAYFYLQAIFYAVLPDMNGTARVHSAVWGMVLLWLTAAMARRFTGNRLAGLLSAVVLSSHNVFYEYATRSRPDIMCAALAMATFLAMLRWKDSRTMARLVVVGLLLGLGGLTHPLALAVALQVGFWLLIDSRGWQRFTNPLLVAFVALAVFSLWIPLILVDPATFWQVTKNQYGFSSSHAFPERLLNPMLYLTYHLEYMVRFIGWWKVKLTFWPLIGWTLYCMYSRQPGMRIGCALAWSSLYVVAACCGNSHTTWGYFVYPVALCVVCAGAALATCAQWLWIRGWPGRAGLALASTGVLGLLVQNSGVTMIYAFAKNRNQLEYNAPAFARSLMADIPPDARCTVDSEYVLDFYVAGRPVLCAMWFPFFFNAESYPYDYYIASRFSAERGLTPLMCGELIKEAGDPGIRHGCFASIYRPSSIPCEVVEYPYPDWLKLERPVPHWRQAAEQGNPVHPAIPNPQD